MIRKTSLIFLVLFICFLTITCVSAQDNVTEEITSPEVDTPVLTESQSPGNFTQLSQDIENGGDTIELDKDYKYVEGDTVSGDGIVINKTLTIDGKGHTIDASDAVRIFSVKAANVIFKNINFINANTQDRDGGSAIFTTASNTQIYNCTFSNNYASESGAAVRTTAKGLTVENSSFNSNKAVISGADIHIVGADAKITNCNFSNAHARLYGASISVLASNATFDNCIFEGNTGDAYGGAVYVNSNGRYTTFRNSTFKSNKGQTGGALAISPYLVSIVDCYFEDNSAVGHGGAVYISAMSCEIKNSEFVNNSAASGGGVYMVESEFDNTRYSNNYIGNSTFTGNHARYGGGGATVTGWGIIEDSSFTNNTAGVYGGAADLTSSQMYNCKLENNDAIFGGALYIQSSYVEDSTFKDNTATVGNSIYILNRATLSNNDVLDEDIYTFTNDTGSIVGNDHDIAHMLQTDEGYFAYCSERYNSEPYSGVYDHSMEKLYNAINHQPIAEYVKILIYQYVDHMDDLEDHDFHEYVWEFTDREYWNSKNSIVKEVIRLYDSGFRVPNVNACKVLANGTLMYFNFSSMITPSGQQNLFLFKFWFGDEINETFTKEALNKTAYIGDYVEYRIVVSNKGTSPVYDVWVEDKDYSKGLIYEDWRAELGDWTYDNVTQHWKLNVLNPAKSASIILKFKVADYGTLYNNATSGVGSINVTNSSDDIYVYTPNFTIKKLSLNPIVMLGDYTEFQIIVNNTGDLDLNDLFVEESSYDGLEYASWKENPQWIYSNSEGKHRWTFNGILAKGEVAGFNVVFKTTARGNFTNVVVAGSNETDNKTANNTTEVLKADLVVEKQVLTKNVVVGNPAEFLIVVRNTGDVDLDDVFVLESKYDSGLEYLSYSSVEGNWRYGLNSDSKHMFSLSDTLKVGESASFRVLFKTTKTGNLTNTVEAGFNNTTVANSTNVTEVVNKTAPIHNNTKNETNKTVPKNVTRNEVTKTQLDDKATGNPLLALLMALAIVPIRRFRK